MLAVATVVLAAMADQGQKPAASMSAVTETRPSVGKDSVKFLVLGDTGMGGNAFTRSRSKDVRFFALDSNYMDKDQQAWLEKELKDSDAKWKIPYFHHPLYSSGATHGSEVDLRAIIEPMFVKYGVNVVFAGHEHFYERLKPQKGIQYFTAGGSAKLREGNIRTTGMTAKGFDTEQSYMLIEIDGDVLRFQAISRRGKVVDSGEVSRQAKPEPKS